MLMRDDKNIDRQTPLKFYTIQKTPTDDQDKNLICAFFYIIS